MDVGCCAGGGLVVALEVAQRDVVADGVRVAVQRELVHPHHAGEAAGEGVVRVDDLFGRRDDLEGRGDILGGCAVGRLGSGEGCGCEQINK